MVYYDVHAPQISDVPTASHAQEVAIDGSRPKGEYSQPVIDRFHTDPYGAPVT